jgi:long-chain-fatty-acid--[acyl-carrier-protein] ligase
MSAFFSILIAYFLRAVFSLRYRIEVRGMETLNAERLNRKQGILFMPNHTAHMDPPTLFVYLWPKFRMRPLETDYVFKMPFLKLMNHLVRAIAIPSFEHAVNEYKIKRAETAIREIAEGLKRGDNFIMYPSGGLKTSAKEVLGGASGAHELLKECPDANVVLIRITGFWGSSFSKALLGRSPNILTTLKQGFKTLLKNLIFFAPRRKIIIELEPNPEGLPRGNGTRIELNRFLENWYNLYPDEEGNISEKEPLKLISYSWWKKEFPKVFQAEKKQINHQYSLVSEETRRKIENEIRRILERPDLVIEPEMNLAFDLGMDSLNIGEFVTYLAKNFDVGEIHPEELETVGSVLMIAEGGRGARKPKETPSTSTWPEENGRPSPMPPLGQTLAEAFLNSCDRMGSFSALGDDLIGVMNYKRVKKATLVLAQYFRTWEEERVGVLLPASIGAYLVIFALQLAGKTPVMINWTLGSRYMEEMMKISGAKKIITSERFLDRLVNAQFGACLDQLVFLEKIRKSLTLSMKLRGVYLAKRSTKPILRALQLDQIDPNSPCVILFTSGTEAAPKGVPLSHKNIISNQRSALQCIDLNAKDVVYGILPPFHSFGFSVAGIFPVLAGMRIAFYPDPTDSFALAEGVERWKVTLFCSAPSFLKGLFHAAKPAQLRTVRLFVSGAEKAPAELFQRVRNLSKESRLIEGYGITECSPILSLNRFNLPPKGVGRLLPDIELVTIHPETKQKLPTGSDGEICVRGPNVFHGYLGNPRTPFIQIEGKEWYQTGDLGHLDQDGNLIISGRLKRFTKIGGEMISLGAVEEAIVQHMIQKGRISPDLPSLAVCADEKEEGKPRLILFSIKPLEKEEANQILQQAGFSNLVKISAVKQIEQIPLMGAGKTDYRTLQGLC